MNEKVIKLGNTRPRRDYIYVEDTAKAYLEILRKKNLLGKIINVGTGNDYSIKEISNKIQKILNTKKEIIIQKRQRKDPSEVSHLKCDNSFLKKANTNWKKSNSFENHLRQTIVWYKENSDPDTSKIYQI